MTAVNQTIQSDSRLRIERVLKEARGPLSAQEVSDLSGVSISITRTHLGNAVQHGRARNLHPGRRGNALYVWGKAAVNSGETSPRMIPKEPYIPKPINTRPGSEAFLAVPSRRGDVLAPHALPMSMAGGGA